MAKKQTKKDFIAAQVQIVREDLCNKFAECDGCAAVITKQIRKAINYGAKQARELGE